jgi:hypothetical protein
MDTPSPVDLTLATRHVAKHLPNTPQMQKLLQEEGKAHVFLDESTMNRVIREIFERGQFTGIVRDWMRYGVEFKEPIGYRIDREGTQLPLYYAEMKVKNGKYHVVPRKKPSL